MGVDREQASGLDREISCSTTALAWTSGCTNDGNQNGDINWHNRRVDGNETPHFASTSRIVNATKCNAAM